MTMTIDNLEIRDETHKDISDISNVILSAFKPVEYSDKTEHLIVEALRAEGELVISLVATVEESIVGHIAFSPVKITDGTKKWYGLAPVSVLPDNQRNGIGKALVEEGLSRLQSLGASGCCLVGHPEYYRQFGFKNEKGLVYEGVPEDVFFALAFDGRVPQGKVTYHDSFNV